MKFGASARVGIVLVLMFGARPAYAALTSSEKAQIRDFVAASRAENASRVRALVARTDLTNPESIEALVDAVAPVPFTEARAIFLRALAFGVSSASARPLLAHAVTRALLARADAVYQKYGAQLDHEPRAIAELFDVYAFLDGTIANAGRPTAAGHDMAAGISAAAYEECAGQLRDHVEKNARWLKGDGVVTASLGRVRAQAQIALIDMLPDGLTRHVDASDRLALKGARRRMLTEWGILLQDAGALDDAKAETVRQALARLPGARTDVELVYAGEDRGAIRARGVVAFAGGSAPGETSPFGDELTPATVDATVDSVIHDLAILSVERALSNRGELRLQAEKDTAAVQGDPGRILGTVRVPSVEHVIGAAAHLLEIDAPRALDLAFVRVLRSRTESAALLSDAIGALASFAVASGTPAGNAPKPAGLSLQLGKGAGATTMTGIRLAPNGTALGFTLEGHAWALERSGARGEVTAVTRDGQAVSLAHLPTAPTPLRDGTSWAEAGYTFTKLRGAPRLGIAPPMDKGGTITVKMVGGGPKGYDVVVTRSPGDDFVLEGDLSVRAAPGGLAFRAVSGRDAVRGAMLVVTPGGRVALVSSDDLGNETPLAALEQAPSMPVHVKISVKGTKVEAVVGTATLSATLPKTLATGDVGLVARRGANVDMAAFTVKKK